MQPVKRSLGLAEYIENIFQRSLRSLNARNTYLEHYLMAFGLR
ncbi:MAG: hypothetical protein WA970_15720 [Gammaproteobacteria bacterium]